jgi:membrane protein
LPSQTENRRRVIGLIRAAARDFSRDQCGLRAAALCYYTVFALPPLLILLIAVAGLTWSPETVQRAMESQFAGLIGADGARAVQDMVSSGQQSGRGLFATVLGMGGLIIGVTGAFLCLQDALNAVWEVGPDPASGGVRQLIAKRLVSLGMVMGLGFLTIVSLAVSAALAARANLLGHGLLMQAISLIVSAATLSVLFAATFKVVPDAIVEWRSVWVGGVATAVLFEVGKVVIGLYLGRSHPGDAFGAASALAGVLVWIYYAGMLVLFGAEFTHEYARSMGHGIRPRTGAVRIEYKEQVVLAPRV